MKESVIIDDKERIRRAKIAEEDFRRLKAGTLVLGTLSPPIKRASPLIERAIQFLDSLPLGKLVLTRDLCQAVGIGSNDSLLRRPALFSRQLKYRNKLLWGRKATVANFYNTSQSVEPVRL